MPDEDAVHATGCDPIADEFETYEAYLFSQVSKKDLYYLEDIELASQLVELGIRGNGETIPREEFEQRKASAEKIRQELLNKKPKRLISHGLDLEAYPLLKARRCPVLCAACRCPTGSSAEGRGCTERQTGHNHIYS